MLLYYSYHWLLGEVCGNHFHKEEQNTYPEELPPPPPPAVNEELLCIKFRYVYSYSITLLISIGP
jgi:hypothetical protein